MLVTIAVSAYLSWFFLRLLIPVLTKRLLDQPNHRSSHLEPVPRGGGLIFVLIASFSAALDYFMKTGSASASSPLVTASLLALPLSLVGFLDDIYNLPAVWRYGVHLATALLVVFYSPLVTTSAFFVLMIPLLAIFVTAIINFTNFMDGLDGLVGGCVAITFAVAAIVLEAPMPIWSLVGALLGFLVWNWSPAKVFMGDVGSTFLGVVFALLVLQSSTWTEAVALLLVGTPLLGDACFCVLRRLLAGHRVFEAHRLHLFQRLYQAGWPQSRVSTIYISATALLAIFLLLGGLPWVTAMAALQLSFALWLDQHVAVPFKVASQH